MVINVEIKEKRASTQGAPTIVCGNSTYQVKFTFDEEWEGSRIKTARFVYVQGGIVKYTDVVFEGDTVDVPTMAGTLEVLVGVFAGDLRTSTPARIPCEASIRCGTGAPVEPTPDVYDQIMALLNQGEIDIAEVEKIVADYITANPPQIEEIDPTVPSWAKQPNKPAYTAAEVGAEAAGAIAAHNVNGEAHNDLRLALNELGERLNAIADSEDINLDQLSEIVAYIKSNKSLIEAITTNKVSVSDIIDNLTTNVSNKPLSAAQGVALKALIDALGADKVDAAKLMEAIDTALAQAKENGFFNSEADWNTLKNRPFGERIEYHNVADVNVKDNSLYSRYGVTNLLDAIASDEVDLKLSTHASGYWENKFPLAVEIDDVLYEGYVSTYTYNEGRTENLFPDYISFDSPEGVCLLYGNRVSKQFRVDYLNETLVPADSTKITIYQVLEHIDKIDEKYLPDSCFDDGAIPSLSIGTVETLSANEQATASITGTPENPVLNLGIPKGEAGDDGIDGTHGSADMYTVFEFPTFNDWDDSIYIGDIVYIKLTEKPVQIEFPTTPVTKVDIGVNKIYKFCWNSNTDGSGKYLIAFGKIPELVDEFATGQLLVSNGYDAEGNPIVKHYKIPSVDDILAAFPTWEGGSY